jgi:hypothetical protein
MGIFLTFIFSSQYALADSRSENDREICDDRIMNIVKNRFKFDDFSSYG